VDGTGLAKLWVVSRSLRARRDHPELFTGYLPMLASGPAQEHPAQEHPAQEHPALEHSAQKHLVAFDRGGAITLATRLPVALSAAGGWGDATLALPPGRYRDVFTGTHFASELLVAEALRRYPVALLLREES
jgi:(1->4)-alpha-D-glucan 1-alpha-D-glucosylmutase